jgi:hypothetical protein
MFKDISKFNNIDDYLPILTAILIVDMIVMILSISNIISSNYIKVWYQKFDFLGYTFKPRIIQERGKIKLGFSPAMSQKSRSRIVKELQEMKFHRWVQFPISKIAEILKLKLRGWINYYGKFRMSEMRKLFRVLHFRLTKWIRNKYRRFRKKPWYVGYKYLQKLSKDFPNLFEHWQYEGFRP